MYHFVRTSDNQGYYTDDPQGLYEPVLRTTGDEQEAIEVCSWAELATAGEEYEHEAFTVYVEDEDR